MKITDYLTNKDVKITDKDFDIEKLENDIRKGYVKETEVESRIDNQKKTWEAEKGKEYDDLKTKYADLEKSYNDAVSNLDKANKDLSSERLKTTMMSHGFKKDQFEEIAKLRSSLFADEQDDEKAIAGIAEKFKGTYFSQSASKPNDGPLKGDGVAKPEIKVTRNTSIKDLMKK
mgnify:FL=1